MRKKKLLLSVGASIYKQGAYIVMGLVLPRIIMLHYGSQVNGLVNSITQFLNYISMLELGLSAVVSSSLYVPLSKDDTLEISKLMVATKKFYRKIAGILILYSVLLVAIYPTFIKTQFDFWYVATLIIAITINLFVQYYFGISNDILLNADQKAYVPYIVTGTTVIINLVINSILINIGVTIQVLYLATSIIYIFRPLIYCLYVNKHYHLDNHVKYSENPIKQRKNGIIHHFAFSIFRNTDIVLLTLFSTLESVSIYSVYFNIVNAVVGIIETAMNNVTALLGSMLSKNEKKEITSFFELYVWFIHLVTVIIFSTTVRLIIGFVRIYTSGLTDANYIQPLFAKLLIVAYAVYVLRFPYNQIIHAAGHYKETQTGAIIEACLNIVLSVLLVLRYGLQGVAIGTLVAMTWRLLYFIWYLSKNILYIPISIFIRNICIDILILFINLKLARYIYIDSSSYITWIGSAFKVLFSFAFISAVIHLLFNKKYIMQLKKYFRVKKFF